MENVDLPEITRVVNEDSSESKADEVLRRLEFGEIIALKNQSKFGEKLLVGLNISEPTGPDQIFESAYEATMKKRVSVVVFAEGNGTIYPDGDLAVVGHRDIVVGQDSQNHLIAYTDYKTRDYLPHDENMKKKINTRSVDSMNGGGNSIERATIDQGYINLMTSVLKQKGEEKRAETILQLFLEKGDPYKIGLGEIMQAISVNYLIKNGILDTKRNIHIQESANKLWGEFGVTTDEKNEGQIKVDVASPKINEVIGSAF